MEMTQQDIKTFLELLEPYAAQLNERPDYFPDNINNVGSPEIALWYKEIKNSFDSAPLLSFVGLGIMIEDVVFELWVSLQTRRAQWTGQIGWENYDSLLDYADQLQESVESEKIGLEKALKDLKDTQIITKIEEKQLKLVIKVARHSYVHAKRLTLLKKFEESSLIDNAQVVEVSLGGQELKKIKHSHKVLRAHGFRAVAKTLAPPLAKFVFEFCVSKSEFFGPSPKTE